MDPIDQLRAARPGRLDTPADEHTRAAELAYAMAQPRNARTRRIAKPVWGLSLVGAATAVAVAVAVVVTGGTAPRAPAGPGGQAATGTESPAPLRLSARQVLLAAAESARNVPAASGAYWYVDSVLGTAHEVGTATRYLVHDTNRNQFWVARSARGTSWFEGRRLGAKPAPGAEEAWRQDGSPTKWTVKQGEIGNLDATPGKPFGNPMNVGDKVFELAGKNVSVAELQALPATPAALKKHLLAGYAGHGTESNQPQDADSWLYQVTSGLLRDMPVQQDVRAAAYEVLAGLDGVRSLGEVSDMQGRTGQGISRAENWMTDGIFERQLIIDPDTGILLADQIMAVKPKGNYAWVKPGTVVWWQATVQATWTDEAPAEATRKRDDNQGSDGPRPAEPAAPQPE
jgi:hypothetical protein